MRHKFSGNRLGRYTSLRKATLRDIAKSTLIHQRICTTKAKAKEARKLVERLITLGKKGTLAHKRRAFAILCDHSLVKDLFEKISHRFKDRQGGYTRIIPLSTRRGDNAHMVFLELTEKEVVVISKPKTSASGKTKEAKSLKPDSEKAAPEHAGADSQDQKKEKTQKSAPPQAHSKHDIVSSKDKNISTKKVVGGFKKMFTKKPTE